MFVHELFDVVCHGSIIMACIVWRVSMVAQILGQVENVSLSSISLSHTNHSIDGCLQITGDCSVGKISHVAFRGVFNALTY